MVAGITVVIAGRLFTPRGTEGAELLRVICGVLFVVAYALGIGLAVACGIRLYAHCWEWGRADRFVALALAISLLVILAPPCAVTGLSSMGVLGF